MVYYTHMKHTRPYPPYGIWKGVNDILLLLALNNKRAGGGVRV